MGAPLGTATTPSIILALDYRGLGTATDIATYSSIHASTYTGHFMSVGRSRKWAPWNITANCATLAERPDGTAQLFLGNGAGTGKIYASMLRRNYRRRRVHSELLHHVFRAHARRRTEPGVAAHRKLFAYLTCYIEGAGNCIRSPVRRVRASASGCPR